MITMQLAEEKRVKAGDSEVRSRDEIALFSKQKVNQTKTVVECFYYHKHGHTPLNCKI